MTLWLSADATDAWRPSPSGRPGGQKRFSDVAIETALVLRLALLHEDPAVGGAVWPALLVTLRRSHTTGRKSEVHPTYKTKYRVANWPAYNRALVRRGDVTVWVSSEAITAWMPRRSGRRGGQRRGIVRLISLDPKNLQSRTIRLQVDATRPERRLGLV